MTEATKQKIEKVRSRLAAGEILKLALKAERLSSASWYKNKSLRGSNKIKKPTMMEFEVPAPQAKSRMSFAFIQGTPDQVREIMAGLWQ